MLSTLCIKFSNSMWFKLRKQPLKCLCYLDVSSLFYISVNTRSSYTKFNERRVDVPPYSSLKKLSHYNTLITSLSCSLSTFWPILILINAWFMFCVLWTILRSLVACLSHGVFRISSMFFGQNSSSRRPSLKNLYASLLTYLFSRYPYKVFSNLSSPKSNL